MSDMPAKQFELIQNEIDGVRDRLNAKDICLHCVGKALMYRGAVLLADHTRDDATIELCTEVTDFLDGTDDTESPPVQQQPA